MKKVIVLSLGGSLIIPNKVNYNFLKQFKKTIEKHYKKYKFVVVCGGGSVARNYIHALRKEGINETLQSFAGISATRMNARFMTYFFGEDANEGIPRNMKKVKNLLRKNKIVFCGALRYSEDQTSDTTSAKLARYFNTDFINLTNVKGLYDKDPRKNKNAKLIKEISWKEFHKIANKLSYKPGQHFILDQKSSKIIMKDKITTYILGNDLKQLENVLKNKTFIGTKISG